MTALPLTLDVQAGITHPDGRHTRAHPVFDAEDLLNAHSAALAQIAWAVTHLPAAWHHRSPGGSIVGCEDGAWSVAENLAHLLVYDDYTTLPALALLTRSTIGATCHASRAVEFQTAQVTLRECPVAELVAQLWVAHERLATLARAFTRAEFATPQARVANADFLFDRSTPGWLVAKSVQHFWEHGATVQRVLLFATRA